MGYTQRSIVTQNDSNLIEFVAQCNHIYEFHFNHVMIYQSFKEMQYLQNFIYRNDDKPLVRQITAWYTAGISRLHTSHSTIHISTNHLSSGYDLNTINADVKMSMVGFFLKSRQNQFNKDLKPTSTIYSPYLAKYSNYRSIWGRIHKSSPMIQNCAVLVQMTRGAKQYIMGV